MAAKEGSVSGQGPWPGVLLGILQCKRIQPQMSLVPRVGGPASPCLHGDAEVTPAFQSPPINGTCTSFPSQDSQPGQRRRHV